MTKEQKFYNTLKDIFVGAKVEGESGYINLMRIKSRYYEKGVFPKLQKDIDFALKEFPEFKEELFDKLYTFFNRYFSESGSIYFTHTPSHQNIYEKVYTDDKDVMLFWKTNMLYYVKSDRLFKSLDIEIDGIKFFFDATSLEHKRANEKRDIIYEFREKRNNDVLVFNVYYSEKGRKTKIDEILKSLKNVGAGFIPAQEILENAFRVFEKQSEVDYFINKNAKEFLKEQFNIWLYQYVFSGESEWNEKRIKQLQILKDIAFKIIDFISQFEDELVKIWNKPKFALNSNYVITLDRIANTPAPLKEGNLLEKILKHGGLKDQIKEWQELGIVDENFKIEDVLKNSPSVKGWQAEPDGVVKWHELPFNPNLRERARELRKAGNLSEVLLWNQVKNKQFLGLDFDRQKIIGDYIIDFYCKDLGVVVEIDGTSHDGKIEYDKQRDDYLKGLDLKVVHILDTDVKNNLSGIIEFLGKELRNTPSFGHPSTRGELNPKYQHLPIDTKYFKDLEIEILSLFDDLDNSLDGWLIKSENYQALKTILPKFKEKVQTIYIDPPFNKETDADYFYSVKYKDASWITLLENRLQFAKDILKDTGSIFVRCDYNGNMYMRLLMNEIFGEGNFRNEIIVNKSIRMKTEGRTFPSWHDSIFLYSKKTDVVYFHHITEDRGREEWRSIDMEGEKWDVIPAAMVKIFSPENIKYDENKNPISRARIILGKEVLPRKGRRFPSQEIINELERQGKVKFSNTGNPQMLKPQEIFLTDDWTGFYGYSFNWDFPTENSEILLKRVIESTSNPVTYSRHSCESRNPETNDLDSRLHGNDIFLLNDGDLILDFFLGSGTTTAVAHKLKRKWIGVEMGEHFYTVVLPRMKKVLFYDKSGISKDIKEYNGGGFFKYYELEQYEDTLRKVKYDDSDLFDNPYENPYNQYVFMKDLKLLSALEVDYKNNKVKVDLSKLYKGIDIPETLSNLLGRYIKKITADEVEFEDGERIDLKDLDYKIIKNLIWW